MKYPLADMLEVRKIRESTAIAQLTKAKNNVESKVQLVRQKKEALDNYRKWRKAKQKELFNKIEDQTLCYSELDYITLKIQWIRTGETVFEKELENAEHELSVAQNELDSAKAHYIKTQKGKLKLEIHQDIWREEIRKESDRKAEDEIEACYVGGKNGSNQRLSAT